MLRGFAMPGRPRFRTEFNRPAGPAGDLPVSIAGVTARTPENAAAFLTSLSKPAAVLDRAELIAASDLIIEAAGGHVVSQLARETFAQGKDLMVISIGAILADMEIL